MLVKNRDEWNISPQCENASDFRFFLETSNKRITERITEPELVTVKIQQFNFYFNIICTNANRNWTVCDFVPHLFTNL